MKKKAKRLLSLMLCVMMLVGAMSSTAFAKSTAQGKCGNNLRWTYNEDTFELTISGKGKMDNYEDSCKSDDWGIEPPWHEYCNQIHKVKIKKGVTSIGDGAFMGCDVLNNVSLPSTLKKIGIGAFHYCYSLNKITIPDSVNTIEREAIGYMYRGYTMDGITIIGSEGSEAQRYADENGIKFKKSSTNTLRKTKIIRVTGKRSSAIVSWKKNTKGKGYQLQYSTKKDFSSGVKTVSISSNKTVKKTVKKLKKKTTYYFRIRTVKGNSVSAWSESKSVITK